MITPAMCALALVVPAIAAAQDNRLGPNPIAVSSPPAAAKKEKLVCETQEATGSRLGKKRVCHTAAEWAEIRQIERRDIERIQANRYKGNQ